MSVTTEAPTSTPIADLEADSLIGDFPEGRRLVGSRCDDCGCTMLDARVVCSECVGRSITRIALPATGNLYSFTRLHVGSEGIRALGYVDLDGVSVRTLADLREGENELRPDMPVRLGTDNDAWFFEPAADEQGNTSNV